MSYKFSALMLCDGNLEAFERSLSSLNNMHGYLKETQLFVFFKNLKYKYQIPIQILKAIKELGDENIILVFEKDEKSSMEQLL